MGMDMTQGQKRYLGQSAISRRLNVSRHVVNMWRARYRGSPRPFPEPDVWVGDGPEDPKAIPGWLPGRIDEIREWRLGLLGHVERRDSR